MPVNGHTPTVRLFGSDEANTNKLEKIDDVSAAGTSLATATTVGKVAMVC